MRSIFLSITHMPRFIRFSLVGAACTLLQLVALTCFVSLGIWKPGANFVALLVSTEVNVFLTYHITWRERHPGHAGVGMPTRTFLSVNTLLVTTVLLNEATFTVLSQFTHYLVASLCGTLIGGCVNYLISSTTIFRTTREHVR